MRDINGNFIHYLSLKERLQKEEALVGGIWLIISYVRKSFALVADDEYLNRAFSELDDCVEWVRETGRPKKEASSSFSVKYIVLGIEIEYHCGHCSKSVCTYAYEQGNQTDAKGIFMRRLTIINPT